MRRNPYSKFRDKELTLNDHLAIDRTILSNERTFLAYGRTSLAMLIVGGSCVKFFEQAWIQALGLVFVVCAVAIGLRGAQRYRLMQQYMAAALGESTGTAEHPMEKVLEAQKDEAAAGNQSGQK